MSNGRFCTKNCSIFRWMLSTKSTITRKITLKNSEQRTCFTLIKFGQIGQWAFAESLENFWNWNIKLGLIQGNTCYSSGKILKKCSIWMLFYGKMTFSSVILVIASKLVNGFFLQKLTWAKSSLEVMYWRKKLGTRLLMFFILIFC